MNIDTLMPLAIALVGSAGLWSFLTMRNKLNHEKSMSHDPRSAQFNDTLREQVDRLSDKLDKVIADKEQLLVEMSDMKAELAQARATIKHPEEMLRSR